MREAQPDDALRQRGLIFQVEQWYASGLAHRRLSARARARQREFMLYKGDGFGRSEFGYAVLEDK